MDKNKLLDSLKAKRNTWELDTKSYWEGYIASKEGTKLLEDIIEEIEANKEDEMWCIQDILSGMKQYCELFQGKCENCFFNITNQINKSNEDYVNCICAYELIKQNVENKGCKND